MKKLILLLVLIATTESFARDSFNVTCEASGFRVSYYETDFNHFSKFYFDLRIDAVTGAVVAKEYAGFVATSDYHGVFKGKGLPEVPYQRASTYKNHFRFKDVDAEYTFGAESGMWGYFVLNKDIVDKESGEVVDGHYVLQAGDHFGGTIDYQCTKAWY